MHIGGKLLYVTREPIANAANTVRYYYCTVRLVVRALSCCVFSTLASS